MTITPFAIIIIPSALQYIAWQLCRFPVGFTYTAVGLWLVSWLARWLQWSVFVGYPLNFVWPATIVPGAILTDWILLKTRSFVITSVIGGMAFSIAFWVANFITLAPFLRSALCALWRRLLARTTVAPGHEGPVDGGGGGPGGKGTPVAGPWC